MALKLKTPREAMAQRGLNMLVMGFAGVGKTRLCATAPRDEPTLIISVEGGLLSIADEPVSVIEITTMDDLQQAYVDLRNGVDFKWLCLDSISEIGEVVLSTEKKRTNSEGNRIDPRQAYGALVEQMGDLIRAFRDLPYNVIMTSKMERMKDEHSGLMLYQPMLPGRQLSQQIPYWFDLVTTLRVEQNPKTGELEHWLQTQRDIQYEGKDRSGKLDMFEPPNLAHLAGKIFGTAKPAANVSTLKRAAKAQQTDQAKEKQNA